MSAKEKGARELFKSYRSNKLEIKRLLSDTCHEVDTVHGSTAEAPYTPRQFRISGVNGSQVTANRIRRERLEAECAYVEAAIALAPNSQIRMILELWTYEGKHWDEVAAALASGGVDASEASVKQTAYRYFKDLDEKKNK